MFLKFAMPTCLNSCARDADPKSRISLLNSKCVFLLKKIPYIYTLLFLSRSKTAAPIADTAHDQRTTEFLL